MGKKQKLNNGLGKAQKLQGKFWQAFVEYGAGNEEYSKEFNKRKALPNIGMIYLWVVLNIIFH